jgi:hypothetical protein
MKALREHLLVKYLWLGMALHIFNFSIDTPDNFSDQVPEDLSINDIESISELVLEKFLGIYNACPEHDEQDPEDGGFAKRIELKCEQFIHFEQKGIFEFTFKRNFVVEIKSNPQPPFLKGLIKPPQA